jgi:hypothetical protein
MSKRLALIGAALLLSTLSAPAASAAELPIGKAPASAALPGGQPNTLPPLRSGADGATGGVLLFDEADSVDTRRSEVPTSDDRYTAKDK